jgi:hypothetical protein
MLKFEYKKEGCVYIYSFIKINAVDIVEYFKYVLARVLYINVRTYIHRQSRLYNTYTQWVVTIKQYTVYAYTASSMCIHGKYCIIASNSV